MNSLEILLAFIEYSNNFHHSECPTFRSWIETQPKEVQEIAKQTEHIYNNKKYYDEN